MIKKLPQLLTLLGVVSASPYAFLTVVIYALAWAILAPGDISWHGVATLATWAMTLFIQRSEHRDTQAIHAKLDELLRAEARASNELRSIDDREPEEIEEARKRNIDTP